MVEPSLDSCFPGFANAELPIGFDFYQGKVRDIFDLNDELLISTSDRISAFDQILGQVPYKGEVLNRLSTFWFKSTRDIVQNHFVAVVSPRAMLVKKCRVVPVEVVARGFLTGSAWRDYLVGQQVSGIKLPDDLRFNERFDTAILTPSTKEGDGLHDRSVSRDEVIYSGIVDSSIWEQIEGIALQLFARGTEVAVQQGLILVDTKYEFGLLNEEIVLVDELHTPDSSRYWFADSYDELFEAGEKQRMLDKEYLRQWLMEQGYTGDGHPPAIPEEVFLEVSRRYQRAYEVITGAEFKPQSTDPEAEKRKLLSFVEERQEEN
ncbi:MAG: phosphoribosylaminoimidazolesuccinocarboxamide synthase [Spirochaetia bacterium]